MVKAVASELQERIEQIGRQAFAAGYAEAMNAVRQLASRPARNSGNGAAEPNRRGQGRVGGRSAAATPNGSRRVRATDAAKTTLRSAGPARAQRGTNALRVEEVLKAARPRAVRPADIRKALQKKRITISFPFSPPLPRSRLSTSRPDRRASRKLRPSQEAAAVLLGIAFGQRAHGA
jgi:hypothetical protein